MSRHTPRAGARAGTAPRQPSQRQLRVGEEIRHLLANVFLRGDLHDPDFEGLTVTVTEVSVSPDLKNATVFVLPLAGEGRDVLIAGLKRVAPQLRTVLARGLTLRHAPRLSFALDTGFEQATRIETILRSPDVARDLAGPSTPEPNERDDDDGA